MRLTKSGLNADLHNFWLKSVSHEPVEKPVTLTQVILTVGNTAIFGIVMIGISLEGEVTLN